VTRKTFILLLCIAIWVIPGQQGLGQESDSEPVRHYILLLDATAPFRIAIKNQNYFSYIREMIYRKTSQVHENYLPYRPGRDIVSIVFFHFPINEAKKITDDGLHTSRSLVFIRGGIVGKRLSIENYIESKLDDFRELAVSPIGLSEVTVLPYINNYIKGKGISFKGRVDRIYLISLSDEQYNVEEAGIKSVLGSFKYTWDRDKYEKLRHNMETLFPEMKLLKSIRKYVSSPPDAPNKVYFHYYAIKPKAEGVTLKLANKVRLARVARKTGEPGKTGMLWSGTNNICLDNQTPYLAWVEWALAPAEGEAWNWQDCTATGGLLSGVKVLSAGCRAGCGDQSGKDKPLVEIAKQESGDPEQDAAGFKEIIWYRGVVDLTPNKNRYAYPFNFRYYLTPKKVEYVSDEKGGKVPYYYSYNVSWYSPQNLLAFLDTKVERTLIDDNLIKQKLADREFLNALEKYIHGDKLPKRFKEYCDTHRGKVITDLPAEILSETSKIDAQETENWAKYRALILYLLTAAAIFLFYYFILRPLIASFNIEPVTIKNNIIILDFSADAGKKEALATFGLESLIRSYHPAKKNPKFTLSFDLYCELSCPGEPLNVVYDHEHLLSVYDKTNQKELPLKTTGNSFQVDLLKTRFGETFDVLLNPAAIEDIETDNIGDKNIAFSLKLTSPRATTRRGNRVNIHKMKIGKDESSKKQWDCNVFIQVKPERKKKDILFKPVPGALTSADGADRNVSAGTGENYALDYTSNTPLLKLFDIEIKNNTEHEFSFPVVGMFSVNTKTDGNRTVSDVFYLSEKEVGSFTAGRFVHQQAIHLKKSDEVKRLYLYIHFDDFSNPVDHCDYTINSYFDSGIEKTLNIRIHRSKEETEALVQIVDGDDAISLEVGDQDLLTDDNSLLVHKELTFKDSLPVSLGIPVSGKKAIKEGKDSQLFTLHLRNNCCTRTGYYEWELKDVAITPDSNIEFDGNPVKLMPTETSGTIADQRGIEEEIEFWIDHKKIKKVYTYHFHFSLTFSLGIRLFPSGSGTQPAGGEKKIKFTANFLCFHDVKENYLVVDFGTSAICAYYYTFYPETPGQNYQRIPLESPAYHFPGEEGLLPSIINLRNATRDGLSDAEAVRKENDTDKIAVAGSEHFVDLPMRDDVLSYCPALILSSIKLLIVKGMRIVPIHEKVNFGLFGEKRTFSFINENGDIQKGNPALESVLKSCYEYLLKLYLKDNPGSDKRRYRKVVLTYPNVYNFSHISFLEQRVFKQVFQETGRVYFENVDKESESNSVLYYYLASRRETDILEVENILVVDIGAGTLDMSYAQVVWEKWAADAVTPKRVEVFKRDGVAMAGDTLDKAISLQVHGLLKRFASEFDDVKYANRIASDGESGNENGKDLLKGMMFRFKFTQILNFKKMMATCGDDEMVEIILGQNNEKTDMCEVIQASHEINLNGDGGETIPVTLTLKFSKVYLGTRKKHWLNLPYLKRFEHLLIDKLRAFSDNLQMPDRLTIVMSGRTSLWPSVLTAVETIFNGENVEIADYIWPEDVNKKALELKRSVILGAIQKTTTWKEVEFKEAVVSGVEAVRYQKGRNALNPDSLKIETFRENSAPIITINLSNSTHFELGIKTSMDFVPFMGADSYKRDDYCNQEKIVTITIEKLKNASGYNFYVKSDKHQKGRGARLQHVFDYETPFLRSRARNWPIHVVQLEEVSPDQFTENV
jgi:hypothetical protein